jgi:hypothetical protein
MAAWQTTVGPVDITAFNAAVAAAPITGDQASPQAATQIAQMQSHVQAMVTAGAFGVVAAGPQLVGNFSGDGANANEQMTIQIFKVVEAGQVAPSAPGPAQTAGTINE